MALNGSQWQSMAANGRPIDSIRSETAIESSFAKPQTINKLFVGLDICFVRNATDRWLEVCSESAINRLSVGSQPTLDWLKSRTL